MTEGYFLLPLKVVNICHSCQEKEKEKEEEHDEQVKITIHHYCERYRPCGEPDCTRCVTIDD